MKLTIIKLPYFRYLGGVMMKKKKTVSLILKSIMWFKKKWPQLSKSANEIPLNNCMPLGKPISLDLYCSVFQF